ncbi:ribonuclease H1 isoform X1 [Stegostoma tigrinum]|uniref:ribonuclease H1 isoform X1 n=1 Tax=Stegostoma tigrinum TaxID=3053191 RepID=UPI00202B64A0|nr:ribonuclease H1 isoform X1 [Stegostoma tigrinum]
MWRFGGLLTALSMGMKKRFYYAVKAGRKPGVYATWDECKEQVDKFPNASFKKFGTEDDAWSFVRNVESSSQATSTECSDQIKSTIKNLEDCNGGKRSLSSDDETCPKRFKSAQSFIDLEQKFTYMGDAVAVYTDGCCSGNGRNRARAGIGVYWGPGHSLNLSERLPGRQTNQRAEIVAACRAIEQAKEYNIEKLVIFTDSMFTINGITKWIKSWKCNGWRLSTGESVIHKEDFERLDKLTSDINIEWMHVPGHAGFPGNEAADSLAKDGASKPPC